MKKFSTILLILLGSVCTVLDAGSIRAWIPECCSISPPGFLNVPELAASIFSFVAFS